MQKRHGQSGPLLGGWSLATIPSPPRRPTMRHSNRGAFRDQVNFLRQQFLQDGGLPFTDVLTEEVITPALVAVGTWLRRPWSWTPVSQRSRRACKGLRPQYNWMRQYDRAIAEAQKALDRGQQQPPASWGCSAMPTRRPGNRSRPARCWWNSNSTRRSGTGSHYRSPVPARHLARRTRLSSGSESPVTSGIRGSSGSRSMPR
jgi:hypothetical protein